MKTVKGRFTFSPKQGDICAPPRRYGIDPLTYEVIKVNSKSVEVKGRETSNHFRIEIDEKRVMNVFSRV